MHTTILLFQIISARPSQQTLMVLTFLKVYGDWLLLLFLQEQTKDIIISAQWAMTEGRLDGRGLRTNEANKTRKLSQGNSFF